MAFFTGEDFGDGAQVTSSRLDAITTNLRIGSDSVDGVTITVTAGVLSVGVLGSGNLGANSVTTNTITDLSITQQKLALLSVGTPQLIDGAGTEPKIADGAISWLKTKSDDRATQTDMQSENAAHFVSPSVLKYHPGVAKAYGRVVHENGVTTIKGGYNVTSATDTGSGRQITLAVTMANTNYVVDATANGGTNPVNWTVNSTTQFTLDGISEASGREISFVVYGPLA